MTFCELHLDYVLLGTPHCIIVNEVNKIIYPEKMNKKFSSLRKQKVPEYKAIIPGVPHYHCFSENEVVHIFFHKDNSE